MADSFSDVLRKHLSMEYNRDAGQIPPTSRLMMIKAAEHTEEIERRLAMVEHTLLEMGLEPEDLEAAYAGDKKD